jgi:CubicO group peptidase (beta-lactamase class C family)
MKFYRHYSWFALLTFAACSSDQMPPSGVATAPTSTAQEMDAEAPNQLAQAVDALFVEAESANAFSGSVLVVDKGRRVLDKGYGLALPKGTRKNAPDSIFRVGSISKQFTASAILKLAQQGKLAVTDPVSKFFPEYPKANLVSDGAEVTLHHLLSHTSGLPDPASLPAVSKLFWFKPIDPQVQVDAAMALPLVRKPGAKYAYLNYNYLLLGLVVERASGEKYEAFLRKELFEPAGMSDTGTALTSTKAERASVGSDIKAGKLTVLEDDRTFTDRDVTLAFGAGQIYSTTSDLAKWDRTLNGETVLNAASKSLLFTPNLSEYGYGWVVRKSAGTPIQWHNGALSPLGFSSYMIRVPSKDRFVVYLSNNDIGRTQGFEEKVEALAAQ